MSYNPKMTFHYVGSHEVSILTVYASGMLPIVVQDSVTREILFFSKTGQPAPGETRARLCSRNTPLLLSGRLNAELEASRSHADILRLMCDSLGACVPGSPEAVAIHKLLTDVKDVVRQFNEGRDAGNQEPAEASDGFPEDVRPVPDTLPSEKPVVGRF